MEGGDWWLGITVSGWGRSHMVFAMRWSKILKAKLVAELNFLRGQYKIMMMIIIMLNSAERKIELKDSAIKLET
jgi:hypothetical protein